MERIEKAVDKFWETVFGLWIVFWLCVFLAFLFAVGSLIHIFEHRTRYAMIGAAIVWAMVLFR